MLNMAFGKDAENEETKNRPVGVTCDHENSTDDGIVVMTREYDNDSHKYQGNAHVYQTSYPSLFFLVGETFLDIQHIVTYSGGESGKGAISTGITC